MLSFYRWLNSDYTPDLQNQVEVVDEVVDDVLVAATGCPDGP